jgi:hypothetical protein
VAEILRFLREQISRMRPTKARRRKVESELRRLEAVKRRICAERAQTLKVLQEHENAVDREIAKRLQQARIIYVQERYLRDLEDHLSVAVCLHSVEKMNSVSARNAAICIVVWWLVLMKERGHAQVPEAEGLTVPLPSGWHVHCFW